MSGLALGRAGQASLYRSGLVQFRPQIFFLRQSSTVSDLNPEFAVASHDHTFMVDSFSLAGGGFDGESLVGGVGIPDGTPGPEE
ncbi:hypothetical protein [Streptomyces lydicamycinicus]|uniref:hypothetical protein n=1 Tax=Streptomyces lydicamycinicus TaxID=1546107 RepID=UPI003C2B5015